MQIKWLGCIVFFLQVHYHVTNSSSMNHETYLWHKEPWPNRLWASWQLELEEWWWYCMHVLLYALLRRTYLSILCLLTHSQTSFAPHHFWHLLWWGDDGWSRKKEGDHSYPREETHTSSSSPPKISLSSLLIGPPLEKERRQNALTYLALLNKSLFTKSLPTLVMEWSLCMSNYHQ